MKIAFVKPRINSAASIEMVYSNVPKTKFTTINIADIKAIRINSFVVKCLNMREIIFIVFK